MGIKRKIYNISSITLIVAIIGTYVIGDYVKFGGSIEFLTSWQYWFNIIINLVLTIMIMVTTRDLTKNKLLDASKTINNNIDFIQRSRRAIIGNAYSGKLDEYLVAVNKDNKIQAFNRKIENQINKANCNPFTTISHKDKKVAELEKLLNLSDDEKLKKGVKFVKVTKSALFSGIDGKIISIDDYDLYTHNTRDIMSMVTYKALSIFLFSAFGGSVIVDFIFNGWGAVYSTLIKLISLLMSVISAIKQADEFVTYNVTEAMNKRTELLSNFINQDTELKEKVIKLKSE